MAKQEIIPFAGDVIRKIWHDEQWFFSVIDVIKILTDSPNPSRYWTNMKSREKELYPIWVKLKLMGIDGKARPSDCANTEGLLRIVMSVPSPKAEPLKLWLAQVGKQAIEATDNPELGFERLKEVYKAKGYTDEWIERRLKSIAIRKELTDEWKKRGVKEGQEYSILTAEIAKETFGLIPSEHAKFKGLEKENLRDHMTNFELIFTMLGEDATRQFAEIDNAQGFTQNHDAALTAGRAAGRALKAFEEDKKVKVVSPSNFLNLLDKGEKED